MSLLLFALSRFRHIFTALTLCTPAALQVACGGGGSTIVQTPVPSNQPTFSHVVLLVEESHSYSEVIGNSSMPNFNSLAAQYGLATQSFADLANNALPQYSFIAPNVDDDAHNGSLAQADTWLQSNVIVPLTASPAFQSTLLIITFDEGNQADLDHGGGTHRHRHGQPQSQKRIPVHQHLPASEHIAPDSGRLRSQ